MPTPASRHTFTKPVSPLGLVQAFERQVVRLDPTSRFRADCRACNASVPGPPEVHASSRESGGMPSRCRREKKPVRRRGCGVTSVLPLLSTAKRTCQRGGPEDWGSGQAGALGVGVGKGRGWGWGVGGMGGDGTRAALQKCRECAVDSQTAPPQHKCRLQTKNQAMRVPASAACQG